jgi:hypothetical protein
MSSGGAETTLADHVLAGTFDQAAHVHLLDTDESLLGVELDGWAADEQRQLVMLGAIQLAHRAASTPRKRSALRAEFAALATDWHSALDRPGRVGRV